MSVTTSPPRSWWSGFQTDFLMGPRAIGTLTLVLGVGSHAINGFVTSAVLPDILRDLGGQNRAFWVFSSFEMMAILAGCLTGALKQRHGGRAPFIFATLLLAAGSVIAGLSPFFEGLIVGRAVQGFGEGMIIALCYALIPDIFPQNVAPKIFALLAGVCALAAGIGPVSAGFLTELWSWRAAFLINIPLTLLLLALILVAVPAHKKAASTETSGRKSTLYGRLSLLLVSVLLLTAIGEFRQPLAIASVLIAGVVCTIWLLQADQASCGTRLFPKEAFRPSTLIGLGTWIVFMTSLAAAVRALFITTYGQVLWGLSVTEASYVAALLAAAWTIFAWISARAPTRSREMTYLAIGPALIAAGLAMTGVAVTLVSLSIFMLAAFVTGAGYGISNQILVRAMMYSAKGSEQDLVSAILPTISSAGVAIGGGLTGLLAIAIGLIDPGKGSLLDRAAIEAAGADIFYIVAALSLIPASAILVLRSRIIAQESK
ncbi:putative MFS permease [Roseibium sp. TrichSKD4]|uniref:MFS transporter n=1 Tax=Roseibium sp. TrichSKD4 TaxID=744980 RepID=UPI0001E569D9|nr:MFS transporter [Roseibium sp. TrichSKD4]EFO31847.1 putative MFS permease [Roseibium sp. TrichSKD4]